MCTTTCTYTRLYDITEKKDAVLARYVQCVAFIEKIYCDTTLIISTSLP